MKKRKSDQRKKQETPPSTSAGISAGANHSKPLVRPVLAIAIVLLALAGVGSWWLWWRTPEPLLPEINLQQAEPQVAASLKARMEAVRKEPKSAAAWGWLGALLWSYDFRTAAAQCLDQASRLDPRNPHWPYYHAFCFIIARPGEAIPLLQKTVALCGSSPEAPRFRLAQLLAEQGRWDEARRELQALMADRPEFRPAWLLAARAAHAAKDTAKAVELARACTEDNRTARAAWLLLGALYREKAEAAAAEQALRRAASLPQDEEFADPYYAEATLLRGDARILCEQAHPLLAAGRIQEASPLVDQLRQRHPDYPETWLLAGRLQLLRKDLSAAEASLKHHLELSPRSAQGHFQLGSVFLAQGQFTNAAIAFQKAAELKPDFGAAHYNRGLALGRAGQPENAIAAFEESLRHNPERFETYLLLADLQLRVGHREAAANALTNAQTLSPDDPRFKPIRDRLKAGRQ